MNWSKPIKVLAFVFPMVFIYILHALPAVHLLGLTFGHESFLTNHSFCYLGMGLVITGRIISHFYLAFIKSIKNNGFNGFVSEGVFKYSRNPGLLGLYVSFLGFFIIWPSALYAICFLIYITHMHFKIKMEEDYLSNKHGENYTIYLEKTRRYL